VSPQTNQITFRSLVPSGPTIAVPSPTLIFSHTASLCVVQEQGILHDDKTTRAYVRTTCPEPLSDKIETTEWYSMYHDVRCLLVGGQLRYSENCNAYFLLSYL